jgi:hypothetical protein
MLVVFVISCQIYIHYYMDPCISNDYVSIRHDRTDGVGGGVYVFVDTGLKYFVVSLLVKFASQETVCINILQGTTDTDM